MRLYKWLAAWLSHHFPPFLYVINLCIIIIYYYYVLLSFANTLFHSTTGPSLQSHSHTNMTHMTGSAASKQHAISFDDWSQPPVTPSHWHNAHDRVSCHLVPVNLPMDLPNLSRPTFFWWVISLKCNHPNPVTCTDWSGSAGNTQRTHQQNFWQIMMNTVILSDVWIGGLMYPALAMTQATYATIKGEVPQVVHWCVHGMVTGNLKKGLHQSRQKQSNWLLNIMNAVASSICITRHTRFAGIVRWRVVEVGELLKLESWGHYSSTSTKAVMINELTPHIRISARPHWLLDNSMTQDRYILCAAWFWVMQQPYNW